MERGDHLIEFGPDISEYHSRPEQTQRSEPEFHFRLDNAAKIFPALLSRRQTTVFHVSAEIDAPVNVRILSEALGAMMVRCPYYHVQLRRGLFWYYLEPSDTEPRSTMSPSASSSRRC